MNKNALFSLLSIVTLVVAPGCSDDTGTSGTGGDGMDTETSATGDGDGDGNSDTNDEAGTTDNMTDTDTEGDGDGDPASTDSDTTDSDTTDSDTTDSDTTDSDTTDSDTTDSDTTDSGDGDGDMNADVCGDGVVTGDEVCDDGVNDGAYGGCAEDCMDFGPFCGDAEVNGPESCDDANDDSADGCLANCEVPGSCLDILDFDDQAGDGEYVIEPKPGTPWTTSCDMSTDGGGWTQISLQHTCNGDLESTLTAIQPAATEGVDMECRAFTQDAGGELHTYTWDIEFPPGFDELWLSNDYALRANGADGGNTGDIDGNDFVQSSWDLANGGSHGDVSFGSGDDPGPVTSFAAEGTNIDCFDCEELFPTPMTPFMVDANTTILRLGWGEIGSQSEGWFPWWAGSIWLR